MFNTDLMVFDEEKQRYILTHKCAIENNVDLARELNAAGVPNRNNLEAQVLDRISRTVYNFIYSHGGIEWKHRVLRDDDRYRPIIQDAMIEQLLYFMANGDLNMTAGVDLQTGKEYNRAAKRDAAYAPMMQDLLAQTDLLYCG